MKPEKKFDIIVITLAIAAIISTIHLAVTCDKQDAPQTSTQRSMLTAPASVDILTVYTYYEGGVKFWSYSPMLAEPKLTQKVQVINLCGADSCSYFWLSDGHRDYKMVTYISVPASLYEQRCIYVDGVWEIELRCLLDIDDDGDIDLSDFTAASKEYGIDDIKEVYGKQSIWTWRSQ